MTDKMRFTPGPWVARHRHVNATGVEDEMDGLGWEVDGPPDAIRGTYAKAADAKLIAAAPDLMEALELIALQKHPVVLQDQVNWQDVANTFVGIARAAIEKARGEA